jgi:hypothetical protein
VENVPVVRAVLDKGHQRKPPPRPATVDSESANKRHSGAKKSICRRAIRFRFDHA